MMEEREKYEWTLREEQIKEIQNARLDVLKTMLEERDQKGGFNSKNWKNANGT